MKRKKRRNKIKITLKKIRKIGGASRWRVCYQRGLPRLVSLQEHQLAELWCCYYLWIVDTKSLAIVKRWLQVTSDIDKDKLKLWDTGDKVMWSWPLGQGLDQLCNEGERGHPALHAYTVFTSLATTIKYNKNHLVCGAMPKICGALEGTNHLKKSRRQSISWPMRIVAPTPQ